MRVRFRLGQRRSVVSGRDSVHAHPEHTVSKRPADLATLLGVEKPGPEGRATTLATSPFRHTRVEALEFPSAPKVWVPAWLFLSEKASRTAAGHRARTVRPRRRRRACYPAGSPSRAARACAPDLRGLGDATPEFGRGAVRDGSEHHNEEHYSWSALILGKPLLGQRVTDLLAVIRGLRARRT